MSENRQQLAEMADALFAELASLSFVDAWPRLEEAGFGSLLIAEGEGEGEGGFGGDWGDLAAIMRLAGYHALEAPLGEHIVATYLLADVGMEVPKGTLSLAVHKDAGVPFGRYATAALVGGVDGASLATGKASQATNPAGEPRDFLEWDKLGVQSIDKDLHLLEFVAFLRVCQTAGALDAALALAIEYCSQRQQFGRPLAKFQAVQQSIASLACEAAAVNCAAQGAALALDSAGEASFEIAAAKLRANAAIKTGCALAHQVHGAIGFTRDYPLNRLTRRMMGWRSEGGNDAYWSERLGGMMRGKSGRQLWDFVVRRPG
ncbi:acyl-CoA dehydrogenase family protein [Qipengyuania sp. CAU 1752]